MRKQLVDYIINSNDKIPIMLEESLFGIVVCNNLLWFDHASAKAYKVSFNPSVFLPLHSKLIYSLTSQNANYMSLINSSVPLHVRPHLIKVHTQACSMKGHQICNNYSPDY